MIEIDDELNEHLNPKLNQNLDEKFARFNPIGQTRMLIRNLRIDSSFSKFTDLFYISRNILISPNGQTIIKNFIESIYNNLIDQEKVSKIQVYVTMKQCRYKEFPEE